MCNRRVQHNWLVCCPGCRELLEKVLAGIECLRKEGRQMAVDLTVLTQAVTDEVTIEDSAIVLIEGLIAQIAALQSANTDATTQAAIDALVAQLNAEKAKLAAAIPANTPAA